MSLSPNISPILLDKLAGLLLPLFLTAASGNEAAARHVILGMLRSYDAQTDEELRLAAEIISFSFGALEALGKSMDPDLPLKTVLRLRGCANALHRSAHQGQRALDGLRKEHTVEAQPTAAPPGIPDTAAPRTSHAELTMSRQQCRATERATAKAQRRGLDQARRDATQALRIGSADGISLEACLERLVTIQNQAA